MEPDGWLANCCASQPSEGRDSLRSISTRAPVFLRRSASGLGRPIIIRRQTRHASRLSRVQDGARRPRASMAQAAAAGCCATALLCKSAGASRARPRGRASEWPQCKHLLRPAAARAPHQPNRCRRATPGAKQWPTALICCHRPRPAAAAGARRLAQRDPRRAPNECWQQLAPADRDFARCAS